MKSTPIINSLVGGELSPKLTGRTDIQQYFQSASDLLNMLVECYGGGKNRPGTYYIADTKDHNKESRLLEFNFSDEQAYSIEVGNYYMRFYMNGGQVVTTATAWAGSTPYVVGDYRSNGGSIYHCLIAHTSGTFSTDLAAGKWVVSTRTTVPYEIATPYPEADIGELSYCQDSDIMYLFHQKYPQMKLSRTGHTAWTLAAIAFDTEPNRPALMSQNITSLTITPVAGAWPAVTLTASAALFDTATPSLHIGSIWKIESGKTGILAPDWEYNIAYAATATAWAGTTPYVVGNFVSTGGNIYECLVDHTSGTFATDLAAGKWILKSIYVTYDSRTYVCLSNHTAGASFINDLQAGKWSLQTIYVKITSVTSNVEAVGNILYGSTLEPTPVATRQWSEGAWSAKRGYPACGTFNEQRLECSSTKSQPQTTWGSAVLEYENFELGADDSDALEYTIATEQAETIKWIFPSKQLILGASGGAHSLGSGDSVTPLTPSNVVVKKQTNYGVRGTEGKNPTSTVRAIGIGSYVYYWQKYGHKLREYVYDVNTDTYGAMDATVLSEHIAKSGVIDMAYQQEPDNILWCIKEDGTMAMFTRQIEQKVSAWTSGNTDGWFESVCCIPGEEEDQVWFIVKRTINGVIKRYVEVLMRRDLDVQEVLFFMDCGISYNSPKVVSAATKASVAVITATSHGFSNGDIVKFRDVVGMTQLNNMKYKIANVSTHTFELQTLAGVNVNSTAYTTYISGGEVRKCVSTLTNLGHLEGKEVVILADGGPHPVRTVTAATIVLNDTYSQINLGLYYQSRVETNDLEAGGAGGTGQGKNKRVSNVTVRLYKSLGCKVGTDIKQDEVTFRTSAMPNDTPPELFTGDKRVPFPSGWNREKKILITQDQPLPLQVLAIIPELETNE